ncbi:MAG: hypothetical protein ACRDV7_13015, partial [Acidimicrobiia bacterium]
MPEAGLEAERLAVAFARVVRRAGLDVPIGATVVFGRALTHLGIARRDGVYWAGRTTLVKRPEDIDAYDRAFGAFWLGAHSASDAPEAEVHEIVIAMDAPLPEGSDPPDPEPVGEVPVLALRWSPAEVLRHADFAAYTPG